MSTNPPSDADLVAAFTADADQAVPVAHFMRQHGSAFRRQPDPNKSRLTRLAPILAVALIVGVAAIFAITRSNGGGHTRPSGASDCTVDLRLAVVDEFQSFPPYIQFTLTYTGSSPCAVLLAPPKVRIINGDGNQMGVTTGGPLAGHTYPTFTVHHGDEIGFGINRFLGCYETPPSHYTVEILTPTARGTSATLKVPLTIRGARYTRPSPGNCATSTVGDVSPLTVTSHVAPPMGVLSGTLSAVGGPASGLLRPIPGSVQITNTQTGASRVVPVNAHGRYSISVAPGTYLMVGRSPEHNGVAGYDCQGDHSAIVTADQTTSSDVYCQEK